MRKVAIFGDSIFRGVITDSVTKKYVFSKSINWKDIETKLNVNIINFSKMGATINYGYSKLKQFLQTNSNTDVVIIEFGGNDSDYYWEKVASERSKKHASKTSIDEFDKMLNKMISLLTERNIKPILVTLPPIHGTRYFDWISRSGLNKENLMFFLNDKEVIYRRQEMFSNKIAEIAYKRSVELVDIRNKFLASDDYINLICEDGVHPNECGENLIVNCFIEKFQNI